MKLGAVIAKFDIEAAVVAVVYISVVACDIAISTELLNESHKTRSGSSRFAGFRLSSEWSSS